MSIPTARELCDATGISPSYAHMILSGDRKPARPLAIEIFRTLGWRHAVIADLSMEEIEVLERIAARAA